MEDMWEVVEEYPSGHEMSYRSYGPATEAQFRSGNVPHESSPSWSDQLEFMCQMDEGLNQWSVEQRLNDLFSIGRLDCEDGETYRATKVRDYVVVVETLGPIYGPYSWSEADQVASELVTAYNSHIIQLTHP